jgi:hypothetical protein
LIGFRQTGCHAPGSNRNLLRSNVLFPFFTENTVGMNILLFRFSGHNDLTLVGIANPAAQPVSVGIHSGIYRGLPALLVLRQARPRLDLNQSSGGQKIATIV